MSSISCKLNKKYRDRLKGKLVKLDQEQDIWGLKSGELTVGNKSFEINPNDSTVCCGLDELNMQGLNDKRFLELTKDEQEELVAKYLKTGHQKSDDWEVTKGDVRNFVVGIPIKVGDGSMYSAEVYNRIKKILIKFGCVQLTRRAYENKNSGNKIVVLAGQY